LLSLMNVTVKLLSGWAGDPPAPQLTTGGLPDPTLTRGANPSAASVRCVSSRTLEPWPDVRSVYALVKLVGLADSSRDRMKLIGHWTPPP
jgi:hypothetical protein